MDFLDRLASRHVWIPYVVPFVLFLLLTVPQGTFPGAVFWAYPLKTGLVALTLWGAARWLPDLGPFRTFSSVFVGLLVFVLWVAIDDFYPHLGTPEAFDPTVHLSGAALYSWILVRLLGATVVVAIMEEVFWRGFLIRWIVKQDFRKVAFGTFTWTSFVVTAVLFSVEHNRWLAGLLAGIFYNLWFYRTRSVSACIIAHGTTNLALGVYVLATGRWEFW